MQLIWSGLKCHQVILCVSTEQRIITQELQLADHGNSTSLLLDEGREKTREEIEKVKNQQDTQLMAKHSPRDTKGEMNGTKLMTDVAIVTQQTGKLTVQESVCSFKRTVLNWASLYEPEL